MVHPIHFIKAEQLGQIPNWSGFMENILASRRHPPEKGTITMVPVINLYSGDASCIFSNLLHIKAPCIIFDQPL